MNNFPKQVTEDWVKSSVYLARIAKGARILFADDNEDMLGIMQTLAQQVGWEGTFVRTPQAIVEAFNQNCIQGQNCYDAIVLDINYMDQGDSTPRLTGVTVANQIRKVRVDIPIIFVSAYLDSMMREEARRIQAETVSKPIDPYKLFGLIAYIVCEYRTFLKSGGQTRNDSLIEIPPVLKNIIQELRDARRTNENHKV